MSAPVVARFPTASCRCGGAVSESEVGKRYTSANNESVVLLPDSAGAILQSISVENPTANDLYLWLFDTHLSQSPATLTAHVLPESIFTVPTPLPSGTKVRLTNIAGLSVATENTDYWVVNLQIYSSGATFIHALVPTLSEALAADLTRAVLWLNEGDLTVLVSEWQEFTPFLVPALSTNTTYPNYQFTYGILAILSQDGTLPIAVAAGDHGLLTAFFGIP
jgi:hypothetical protein